MNDSHLCKGKTDYHSWWSCQIWVRFFQVQRGDITGILRKRAYPKTATIGMVNHTTLLPEGKLVSHTGSVYLRTTFTRTKGIAIKMMLWADVSWYLTLQPISFLFYILLKDSFKKPFRNDQLRTILISIKGGMWGVTGSHGSRLPIFGYYRTLTEVMFETETR